MATDQLSRTFAAFADPTRRAILARLAHSQTTVNELDEPFAMSLPAVSKHPRVLETAGLIARGRDAQWRPARLVADPLQPAASSQQPTANSQQPTANFIDGYRAFWEHSFDELNNHPSALQKGTDHD